MLSERHVLGLCVLVFGLGAVLGTTVADRLPEHAGLAVVREETLACQDFAVQQRGDGTIIVTMRRRP